MEEVNELLKGLLGIGLDNKELTSWHLSLRVVICYLAALAIVRMGHRRFMGKVTAFDVLLGIMLGSLVSRAITGNAPFLPTLVAAGVMVAMHYVLAILTFNRDGFERTVKGKSVPIIREGEVDRQAMRKTRISDTDLRADLRMQGVLEPTEVKEAHLERNGDLTVIKAEKQPKVLEIAVAEGVQTIRIQLHP